MAKGNKKRQKRPTEKSPYTDFPIVQPSKMIRYHCERCGECCCDVEQGIPLQPFDIFRLAKYLRDIGHSKGSIENVIEDCTDIAFLTDFGYPALFAKTIGDQHRCIFLNGVTCMIHAAKPRACRLYPFSAQPKLEGDGFDYLLVSRKQHHFETEKKVNVGTWMREHLSPEDREVSLLDLSSSPELGRMLRELHNRGVNLEDALKPFMFFMYFSYDLDDPFLPQYRDNIGLLRSILSDMIRCKEG